MTNAEFLRKITDEDMATVLYYYVNYCMALNEPVSKLDVLEYLRTENDEDSVL